MKRRTIAIVIIIMLCTLFQGCETEKIGQRYRIKIWSGATHSKEAVGLIFNRYNRTIGKEKGIYIDFTAAKYENLTEKVDVALQSGTGPDLMSYTGTGKNVFFPINLINGGNEIIERHYLATNQKLPEKDVYSVPIVIATQGLLYNCDMFREAGIVDENGNPTPPETFEQLRDYALRLTDRSKNKYGIIFPIKWDGWYGSDITGPLMSSTGFYGYNPKIGEFDYSGVEYIAETYLKMRDEGSVYPGGEVIENDSARAIFAAGNIGMKFGFHFDVGVLSEQFPAKCDWSVAPYPVIDINKKYKQRMSLSESYAILNTSQGSEKFDKIVDVWKYTVSDDFLAENFSLGGDIPYNKEIMNKTGRTLPPQLVLFAKMADISACDPNVPKIVKEEDFDFVRDVWLGKMSVKEYCEERAHRDNEALHRLRKEHPELDEDYFIDKNWNIER